MSQSFRAHLCVRLITHLAVVAALHDVLRDAREVEAGLAGYWRIPDGMRQHARSDQWDQETPRTKFRKST